MLEINMVDSAKRLIVLRCPTYTKGFYYNQNCAKTCPPYKKHEHFQIKRVHHSKVGPFIRDHLTVVLWIN